MKNSYFRVVQRSKTTYKKCKTSGHEFPEMSLLPTFDVIGPLGIHSTHRSEKAADAAAKELEAFYQKFFKNLYKPIWNKGESK